MSWRLLFTSRKAGQHVLHVKRKWRKKSVLAFWQKIKISNNFKKFINFSYKFSKKFQKNFKKISKKFQKNFKKLRKISYFSKSNCICIKDFEKNFEKNFPNFFPNLGGGHIFEKKNFKDFPDKKIFWQKSI